MAKPKVAVLGGSGVIGSQVGRRLLRTGFEARGSYYGDEPGWQVGDLDWSWHEVNLDSRGQLRRFVEGATAVIDCAGYDPRRALEVERAKQVGVRQTRAVAEACMSAGVRRVVYVSSASTVVSDEEPSGEIDETSRYVPGTVQNSYFEAKAAMEAEWYRYIAGGLDVVICMPTTVLGPGDVDSPMSRIARAVAGRRLSVVPRGLRLNVVDVRDVAAGVVAALQRGRRGRRYILGGENVDVSELVEEIARAGRRRPPRRQMGARAVRPLAVAGERLIQELGWSGAPPILVAADVALRGRDISIDRARGELHYQCRSLAKTVGDTVRWLSRTGYLSWTGADASEALDPGRAIC